MKLHEDSWLHVALSLGFASEEEMLKHLYIQQEFSIKDIGRIIGYATWSVRRRLLKLGVPLKSRGGSKNKLGKRLLKDVPNDRLFAAPYMQLVVEYQCHPSTVFTERRLRQHELLSDSAD